MTTLYEFAGLDGATIQVASVARLDDFRARFFGLWPLRRIEATDDDRVDIAIDAISDGFRIRHGALEGGAVEVPDAAEAANQLVGLLAAELLSRRSDLIGTHAGAAAGPGGVILLVGDSLSGKSTLALQLARRGARFFGDDRIALAPGGRDGGRAPAAIGLGLTPRMRLPVHPGAGATLAAFVEGNAVVEHMDWQGEPTVAYIDLAIDAFPVAAFGDSAPIAALVLPRRRDDDADVLFLDDATQNEAALALLRQSTAPGMESPQLVAAVAEVARSVPCLRLEYGSSAAACDLLCQRFDIA